ncbi:MAG TPA: aldehyde dehydrogenase family protein [Blastocatellia bacterium]|jgi:acetaldehyde dehydrogenase (acetylating)|nr:aldehyde dehydrogenase family protein [Blastocatellia bacterium]
MSSDKDTQSVEQARDLAERAFEAQKTVATFSQEKIDEIVGAMARAAQAESHRLGEMAHLETGFGNAADKATKNRFSAETIYNFIKPMRTVGVIRQAETVIEVASPRGVVAAIIPSTNPTSTAIFKILIAIKARDSVVLSPHPSASACIGETARVMRAAGEAAGLPPGAIGCMSVATIEGTQELMKHKRTALILATGGIGLVRAAYSSGKPAFGVGPGNVPAMIERTADVAKAVKDILTGKCFDNGTICSSEQAVVVERPVDSSVRERFSAEGGYFVSKEQQDALARVVATATNTLNPKIVGKSPRVIAEMAGFTIPEGTRAILCEPGGVGRDFPLSMEKLSPILAYYVVDSLEEGCERASQILRYGGMGHTASVHTGSRDAAREYGIRMPVSRVIVNSPSTHGAIGFTTDLEPSMTLGCGSWGGNVTSDNISPRHLLDVKRIAFETKPINQASVAPVEAARPSARGSVIDRAAIATLVDRFLAERHAPAPGPPEPVGPPVVAPAVAEPRPASPRVNGRVYDFVCEEDVKRAIAAKEKIHINGKTIITPSARELGEDSEIFAR